MLFNLLLLLACTGPTNDDKVDDTGSADDTDDTDEGEVSCLAFHGIRSDSSRWVHDLDTTAYTDNSSWIMDVVAYDPVAGTASVSTKDYRALADGSQSYDNVYLDQYSCDEDGLYLVSTEQTLHSVLNGAESDGSAQYQYDPPMLVRPGSLTVGDSWHSAALVSGVDSHGNHVSSEVDTFYVVGAEDVTEGEWTGFRIDRMVEDVAYPHFFKAEVGVFQEGWRILEVYTP